MALALQEDNERRLEELDNLDEGPFQQTGAVKKPYNRVEEPWYNPYQVEPYYHWITSAPPMTDVEAPTAMQQSTTLPLHDRWRLYQYWVRKARQLAKEEIRTLERKYCEEKRRLMELHQLASLDVLKQAKIISMTTTGAAMHQSALKALRPRVVIVEEAAEVLEAHIVSCLTSHCEHLILIGDHQQLRPNPAVYELARKYNLEISLFERLIKNGYPHRMLERQHRMRSEISRTLMPHFYAQLRDSESVAEYLAVMGMQRNMYFFSHDYPEASVDWEMKSHSNEKEARFAVELAN